MKLGFTKIMFFKKVHLELEFLMTYNLLLIACVSNSFDTFFITFFHVTLIKERKKRNPHPQLLTV